MRMPALPEPEKISNHKTKRPNLFAQHNHFNLLQKLLKVEEFPNIHRRVVMMMMVDPYSHVRKEAKGKGFKLRRGMLDYGGMEPTNQQDVAL